jgi:hypothetical protein
MPHFNNKYNTYVVRVDELVPEWYNSLDTLQKEIGRHKDLPYGIKKIQSGGNGRELLISFDTLKNDIQQALGDPRKIGNALELFWKWDEDAGKYYNNYEFEDGSTLRMAKIEEYTINASMLASLIRCREARIHQRLTKGGNVKKDLYGSLMRDAEHFQNWLRVNHNLQHSLNKSLRRFKEDVEQYETKGYAYLVSGKAKNKNAQKVTDTILALLNNLFAKQSHKPTPTEVSRLYEGFLTGYVEVIDPTTGEMFEPKDFKQLSDATVINYLAKWEHRIANYAVRSGNRQVLMQQFKPWHKLERPKFANSIISIDDRQPPFTYGNRQRVWFYNGIDLASGAFVAWVWGKSKEGIILEFYRQLLRNYHEWGIQLPAELEGEMSLNSTYMNTFLRPGTMFDNVRIEANNARGKRIESYFRPLRYQLEKKRTGWLARPFAISEANQASAEKVPDIPYNQIIEGSLADIQTWQNMPSVQDPTMSCWDYFMANQNPNLSPTNYKAILPHLGYATHTSCNVAQVRLNQQEFLLGHKGILAVGEKLITLMKLIEGEKITAYWLNDNDGLVMKAMAFIGDQYICELILKPSYNRAKIEQTPADMQNRELMSSYVATIGSYQKHQVQKLEQIVVIDNRIVEVNQNFKIRGLDTIKNYDTTTPAQIIDELILPPTDFTTTRKTLADRF